MEEKSIMAITLIRVCQDPVFTQGIGMILSEDSSSRGWQTAPRVSTSSEKPHGMVL